MRKLLALSTVLAAVCAASCLSVRRPLAGGTSVTSETVREARPSKPTEKGAEEGWKSKKRMRRMIEASETALRPVYGPLAEYVVNRFKLQKKEGVGIDLGSGPGTLIVELCDRTENLHWVNADINPLFFPYFMNLAKERGCADRVSAIYARASELPFRSNYASAIVSRGSYHFWDDAVAGFEEVYRVLEPGGVAFIGRGLSPNVPPDLARQVRSDQGKDMEYDPEEKAVKLRGILEEAGIDDYTIHLPDPEGAGDVNYGLWAEIHKPE